MLRSLLILLERLSTLFSEEEENVPKNEKDLCPHGEDREENRKKQINNSELYAGSSMYFYCHYCGALADTLPESWDPRFTRPKTCCRACEKK